MNQPIAIYFAFLTPLELGVQILDIQILISWPIFKMFHFYLKAIKAFDQIKKVPVLYLYGFAERRVKGDAVVSIKW